MCGIAGMLDLRRGNPDPAATALAMADTLAHRGPDGRDAWGDAEAGIGLGHRRLSIIDLSPTGAQPMHSADGRYVIIYNGEVYNFRDLRRELEALGHRFRGTSDTEVMLAAFVQWGLESAVKRFVGMFAFALFDRRDRVLHLVRDRVGVKPLYWNLTGGVFLFGSEMRALMAHPSFRKEVDREAVDAIVRYSYVPAPATIFRGAQKLPPGSMLTIGPGGEPSITSYWQLTDVLTSRDNSGIDRDEATAKLDALMGQAVRQRMIADVPIGAFLSGGVDSSAVVALMQANSERPVKTFTIGFGDAAYDESPHARAIARHLGTDHTEVVLDADTALPLVRNVADWFDEPFADSSQLPTYLVARMTRQYVTVALSGDGGDELFGGYPKYAMLERAWGNIGWLRQPLRALIGRSLGCFPEPALRRAAGLLLDSGRSERIGEKTRRFAAAFAAADGDEAAMALGIVGLDQPGLVKGAAGSLRTRPLSGLPRLLPDLVSRMQAHDMASYLPDDILTKVDRCSMAVSLEAREPLLDHRVIEYVWSLPQAIRRGNAPKALLKSVLNRYVPSTLIDRPKRGFSIPLGAWLTGPLHDWAEDLLSPAKLKSEGLFDVDGVRRLWQRHLSGRAQNATALWNILMTRAWSERWLRT